MADQANGPFKMEVLLLSTKYRCPFVNAMATSMEQIVVQRSRPLWALTTRSSKSFMQASLQRLRRRAAPVNSALTIAPFVVWTTAPSLKPRVSIGPGLMTFTRMAAYSACSTSLTSLSFSEHPIFRAVSEPKDPISDSGLSKIMCVEPSSVSSKTASRSGV